MLETRANAVTIGSRAMDYLCSKEIDFVDVSAYDTCIHIGNATKTNDIPPSSWCDTEIRSMSSKD